MYFYPVLASVSKSAQKGKYADPAATKVQAYLDVASPRASVNTTCLNLTLLSLRKQQSDACFVHHSASSARRNAVTHMHHLKPASLLPRTTFHILEPI